MNRDIHFIIIHGQKVNMPAEKNITVTANDLLYEYCIKILSAPTSDKKGCLPIYFQIPYIEKLIKAIFVQYQNQVISRYPNSIFK